MNMTENKIVANNSSSIVLYTTDDGNTQLSQGKKHHTLADAEACAAIAMKIEI